MHLRNVATYLVTCATALGVVSCGGGDSLDASSATTVAALALGETEQADDDGTLGVLAFSEAAAASAPGKADTATTAEERVAAFKQYVEDNVACANTVDIASGAKITFSKNCLWAGRRWTGEISFTYADANTVAVAFSGLSVAGAVTEGTLTATRLGDGHNSVIGSRQTTLDERVLDATIDAEYRWDDESITIVSSKRVRAVEGASRTYLATGVHWLRGDLAPDAGTMTWTTRAGATYTVAYSRDDEDALQVTVTTPSGTTTLPASDVAN